MPQNAHTAKANYLHCFSHSTVKTGSYVTTKGVVFYLNGFAQHQPLYFSALWDLEKRNIYIAPT